MFFDRYLSFWKGSTRPSLLQLASKYYIENGTRKPDHYFQFYEAVFQPLRSKQIDLLEVGVSSGASLLIWRDFFPNANIVGLDIGPAPERISRLIACDAIRFVQGDQASEQVLRVCLDKSKSGKFHVVIDDASHIGALSKSTFDVLFMNGVHDGGLYFVEDYGTGYMPSFPDGHQLSRVPAAPDQKEFFSHCYGMVGWMKQLIDELHNEDMRFDIEWIQFFHSIALVQKRGPRRLVEQRFVAS